MTAIDYKLTSKTQVYGRTVIMEANQIQKKMKNNPEYHICLQIANYLRYQYPKVLFHFDYAGLNLSKAQAGMMKGIQGQRGFPDLFIIKKGQGFNGLFIEIKAESPFNKDGLIKNNSHLHEQFQYQFELSYECGFMAKFGTGFDEIKQIIDEYLK